MDGARNGPIGSRVVIGMGRLAAAVAGALALVAIVFAATVTGRGPTIAAPPGRDPVNPQDVYDPYRAGETLPDGYRQLLRRDVIAPVYDPTFVPAAESGWADDLLVVGVVLDGDARAYPVNFLNRREMVIDRIAGIPVLVTW